MKTTQQRLIVLLAAVGVLAVLGAAWVARARDDTMTVRSRLLALASERKETGKDVSFSMADITPFEWDAMHVFGPYTGVAGINKALGFTWSEAKGADRALMNDGIVYLVFVRDGSVVCDLPYSRGDGDFDISEETVFRPGTAHFVICERQSGEQWLAIRPDRKAQQGTAAAP